VLTPRPRPGTRRKKNSKKLGSTVCVFSMFSLTCQCSKICSKFFVFWSIF
jgi:hypothetical protein